MGSDRAVGEVTWTQLGILIWAVHRPDGAVRPTGMSGAAEDRALAGLYELGLIEDKDDGGASPRVTDKGIDIVRQARGPS